jgi:putative addiction module component (TIGR02574 family)
MGTVLEIEDAAMQLPAAERELLANRLLRSLDGDPVSEVDQAWIDEAERRFQDHQAGRTRAIPGSQVFEEIRQELGWQR